jgi:hypothetical protein
VDKLAPGFLKLFYALLRAMLRGVRRNLWQSLMGGFDHSILAIRVVRWLRDGFGD